MNDTPVRIRCKPTIFNDIHQEKLLRIFHNSSAISRNKEILLFKIGVTMLQQQTSMQNQLFRTKVHTQCYIGLCFCLEPRQHAPKHFEYDQIKIKIFGLKDEATKPLKRERAKKPHKLPLFRCSLKFKMSFLVKLSHKILPLFNRFSNFRQECL